MQEIMRQKNQHSAESPGEKEIQEEIGDPRAKRRRRDEIDMHRRSEQRFGMEYAPEKPGTSQNDSQKPVSGQFLLFRNIVSA